MGITVDWLTAGAGNAGYEYTEGSPFAAWSGDFPYTYSFWFKQAQLYGSNSYICGVGRSVTNNYHTLTYVNPANTRYVNWIRNGAASEFTNTNTGSEVLNTWFNFVVRAASATSITLYLDGVQQTDTGSDPALGSGFDFNRIRIGNRPTQAAASGVDGSFADFCLWNIDIGHTNAIALGTDQGSGTLNPESVPFESNQIFRYRLLDTSDTANVWADTGRPGTLTAVGTPADSDHPPVEAEQPTIVPRFVWDHHMRMMQQ